jgi:hypothetical protein
MISIKICMNESLIVIYGSYINFFILFIRLYLQFSIGVSCDGLLTLIFGTKRAEMTRNWKQLCNTTYRN